MRFALAAFILALLFATGAIVYALGGFAQDADVTGQRGHRPSSADERAAAAVALEYARAVQRRDPRGACRHAAGALVAALRCDEPIPYVPSGLRIAGGEPPEVVDAEADVRTATMVVAVQSGPVHYVKLGRAARGWLVTRDDVRMRTNVNGAG